MKNNKTIEEILKEATPKLTAREQDILFSQIETKLIKMEAPTISPYYSFRFISKPMMYVALVLMIMLGAGGTVAASESAKPGDLLFPIDRLTEELRLALASDSKKTELESHFLNERFDELNDLFSEVTVSSSTNINSDDFLRSTSTNWSASSSVEFEADVFTDATIVKIEVDDRKAYFSTNATSALAIAETIATRYGLTIDFVQSRLSVEVEDRASRPTDTGRVITLNGEQKLSVAIATLLTQADKVSNEESRRRLNELLNELENIIVGDRQTSSFEDIRIKVKNDRIEIKTDDERILIDDKDGEIRVKYDDDDHDNGFGNDDNNNRDDSNSNSSNTTISVEVDVFTDITVVEVELNDVKTVFTLPANTNRSAVVSEVSDRYGVSEAEVDSVLDFEIEDRASRSDDQKVESNKDDDDDDDKEDDDRGGKNEDDDEDEDEDDDEDDDDDSNND